MFKRISTFFMVSLLLLTMIQVPAMAANWAPSDEITISVRVLDTKTYNTYVVGTDKITKGDQFIRSDAYTIKPLSAFTSNASNVEKVAGNWYFPTSDQKVGSTVYFSCNSDTATITYWVSGYTEGTGTGSTKNETVNLGGSGSKTLNYSVVYHSNYPDGKDYQVTVKYTVKSYTASRNMFSSAFKTYSACSFGGFKILENEKTWYADKNCETKKGSIYAANNGTYHLYAGWKSEGTAAQPVTLTCYDESDVNSVRTVINGDSVTLSAPQPAKANAEFAGWATSDNSTNPEYKENQEITLSQNTALYAVWKAATPTDTPKKDDTELNYSQPYPINNNYAYLFGFNDNTIGADDYMLRGEVSAVIYRLLKQNGRLNGFSYDKDDTPAFANLDGRWERSSIEFMTYIGVYKASPSENIAIGSTISRGEAFKMFAIAMGCTDDLTLSNKQYTQILADLGYVNGDSNGTTDYRISDKITRAEICKIYNKITGRDDSFFKLTLADETTPVTAETYGFTDLSSGHWAYDVMLKATSSFDNDGYVDLSLRENRNALDGYAKDE